MALIACEECKGKVSDRAVTCPHCGVAVGAWKGVTAEEIRAATRGRLAWKQGYEYRSKATLFGWPLVHIAQGLNPETGRPKVARGVIAIGNIAVGGLAVGGIAFGGLTFGGLSLGLCAVGGLAIGLLLGVGGMAVGTLALGGGAVGFVAIGGGAFGYYALGGGGYGVHALTADLRDPEALRFFTRWFGPLAEPFIRGGGGR